jgi:nucleoside-diphosphate-sugar epimerase
MLTGSEPANPAGLGADPTASVIILGANGRLGQACLNAFHGEGWSVAAFARSAPKAERLDHVEYLEGDALDAKALTRAVFGYDVIINAVNVAYEQWAEVTPKLTQAVGVAAASTGATIIMPGNVYHYGAGMPSLLSETTPSKPTTKLGIVRLVMERDYQSRAVFEGFQTLILRAGDFLDGHRTGGWFDGQIAGNLAKGKVVYPGPLNIPHEWAYLPDFARAIVALASAREQLPAFLALGYSGHCITGQELVKGLEATLGTHLKLGSMAWPLLKLASFFSPTLKGVTDMSYLWRKPHAIDGSTFHALFPQFTRTPLSVALSQAAAQLAINKT